MKTKHDFENCIVIGGVVHELTSEVRKNDGVVISNICTICSLRNHCVDDTGNLLCNIFEAEENEYFTDAASVVFHAKDGSWRIEDYE